MAAVAQSDADDVLYQERLAIRDKIPLQILVGTCECLLKHFESDFAVFIRSIPEIDPEALDPDNRTCPICWTDFTLQLKHDPSTHSKHDPTLLRLPCAHHICKACTHHWLPRAGTCPLCRQQFGPRNGIYKPKDYELWFRLREPYEAIAEIAPIYLASNPKNHTFGEFVLWLFANHGDHPDALQTRAQLAIDIFQAFTLAILKALRNGPTWRRLLMKCRVGNAGSAPMQDIGNEDEIRNDERDIREKNFETPDDAGTGSEGYRHSSNGEEHVPTDDDREDNMVNENFDTAASKVGEEEDIMDEREDGEEDLMEENEDADQAAAAWGEEREEEEDSTDEGEVDDEMVDDENEWEFELEDDDQHTLFAVLGCAVLVSMVGMGLFMNL